MKNELSIRKAVVEDVPLILSFIKQIAEYEKLLPDVTATEELLTQSLFSENSNSEVLLAFIGQEPVAYAVYFYNFSTFVGKRGLYLEDIFVKPEYRGKGYGKKILRVLAKTAIENNCGRMEWAVLDWNKPAIDFYKGIGAESMDGWTIFRLSEIALQSFVD